MGSISFKYKKPVNYAYAPGFSVPGVKGMDGVKGINGSIMYFIDYEFDNSHIKELAIQKLKNNMSLTSIESNIPLERKYSNNDLILTNKGNCYRIKKLEDGIESFDIEYIGKIYENKEIDLESTISMADKVNFLYVINETEDSNIQGSLVPNNRQIFNRDELGNLDTYTPKTNDSLYSAEKDISQVEEAFKLYGVWYKFVISVSLTEQEIEAFRNMYDIFLEIDLKNKKSFNKDTFDGISGRFEYIVDPVDSEQFFQFFKFNKTLEFPCDFVTDNTNNFADITSKFYLSDMSMDKVHMFGTNLKCAMIVDTSDNKFTPYDSAGIGPFIKTPNINAAFMERVLPDEVCGDAPGTKRKAIYNSIFENKSQHELTLDDVNWRAGDTAFFSSMPPEKVKEAIKLFMNEALNEESVRIGLYNKNTLEVEYVTPKKIIHIPE